jgi:hypothetical protein
VQFAASERANQNASCGKTGSVTFYLRKPISLIETRSLPTLSRSYPGSFTLTTRTFPVLTPATLAALPSPRAIPDRDVFCAWHAVASAKVGCSSRSLHSCPPKDGLAVASGPERSVIITDKWSSLCA